MRRKHSNKGKYIAAAGVAAGVGVSGAAVAAGLAKIAVDVVYAAATAPEPIKDGPDPRLENPEYPVDDLSISTTDGSTIAVHAYGPADGQPVVLIHGWTCSARYWNPQLRALAEKGFRAIAYDIRGHGDSPVGPSQFSSELLGGDLESVLKVVVPEGKKAVLVGHSMGGMTIMAWAKHYQESVARRASAIALVSTAADEILKYERLTSDLPAVLSPVRRLAGLIFLSFPLALPPTPRSYKLVQYLTCGTVARRAHVDFVETFINECSPRARSRWGRVLQHTDLAKGLVALNVPTAVLVGEEDRMTPPDQSARLAHTLRESGVLHSLTVLPAAGHMVPTERIDETNSLIAQLVSVPQ